MCIICTNEISHIYLIRLNYKTTKGNAISANKKGEGSRTKGGLYMRMAVEWKTTAAVVCVQVKCVIVRAITQRVTPINDST